MKTNTLIIALLMALFTYSVTILHAGPYNTNLLANPGFEDNWDNWSPAGLFAMSYESEVNIFGSRWVTSSWAWNGYSQEVDLIAAGFSPEELDNVPFTIDYYTWLAAPWGGYYSIEIEARTQPIYGEDPFMPEPGEEDPHLIASSSIGNYSHYVDGNYWRRSVRNHTDRFTITSPGVRYISMAVNGRDSRSWAGHYGPRFDANYLAINRAYDAPQPRTAKATNVSYTSARINGYMDDLGIDNPTDTGLVWNTTGTPTIADNKISFGTTINYEGFYADLTNLSPDTRYYVRAYSTNVAGLAYGEEVSLVTSLHAANLSPNHNALNTSLKPELNWDFDGIKPSGYKLFLGLNNPPTELVYSGELTSYQPEGQLPYGHQYFWKVVPYVGEEDGYGETWSFTTTDVYESGAVEGVAGIEPEITLPNVSGSFDPVISTGLNLPDAPNSYDSIYITISGVNMSGRFVVINPNLGFVPQNVAYKKEPSSSWNLEPAKGDWTSTYVYFTVAGAKAAGDLTIIFPNNEDSTLPVELSSFTAIMTGEDTVLLSWTTQSETNLSGFRVYRSVSEVIPSALLISPLIPAQNSSTVNRYRFDDGDILEAGTYYYWLEGLDMDGINNFYGPVQFVIETAQDEINLPELPVETALLNAYPNPFNPNTYLRYQLAKAADVRLDVYNSKGQLVRSFQAFNQPAGIHNVHWDGQDKNGKSVTSGLYFYQMTSGKYKATRKVIMMK